MDAFVKWRGDKGRDRYRYRCVCVCVVYVEERVDVVGERGCN